ncbi:MAG: DUF2202 domain-containing protein [Sideroxyarcus sp.]|nr:DUF2202 domain-containing protein [Sideroxyarcus sp.]
MKIADAMRFLMPVVFVAAITGCGGGGGSGEGRTIALGTLQPLVGNEEATMLFIREEEKMARDVYLALYSQWAEPTFDMIATRSEQKHMDSVKAMLDNLSIPDPVADDSVGAFTNTDILAMYGALLARGSVTLDEGLAVGAYIEEYDIVDVQRARDEVVSGSNQLPILQTYDSLLCGSRNHLRSFVGQIRAGGAVYTAQLMTQAAVDAIVNSSSEQCGRQI